MKDKVYNYFYDLCKDTQISQAVCDLAEFISFGREELILNAGEKTDYICLVVSGLVRGYYIDEDGNDITKCFSLENDWCCSYTYLSSLPSPFFLEALEDTLLAKFRIKNVNAIMDEYPVFKNKIEQLLRKVLLLSEQRIMSFTSLDAKDRYILLKEEQPELISRVKQEHIASYIGVTPSSLSRIKRLL